MGKYYIWVVHYNAGIIEAQLYSLWVVVKLKLADCCGHNVLSVYAVIVTLYCCAASRPDRIARLPALSSTTDVSFNHSTRYTKDHISGVAGDSHNRSTFGGTGLTAVMFSGGPGQSMHGTVAQGMVGYMHAEDYI